MKFHEDLIMMHFKRNINLESLNLDISDDDLATLHHLVNSESAIELIYLFNKITLTSFQCAEIFDYLVKNGYAKREYLINRNGDIEIVSSVFNVPKEKQYGDIEVRIVFLD